MTIAQNIQPLAPELYPSAYDRLVEEASYDPAVADMAENFGRGKFGFDPNMVAALALKYGIFPDDVTEYACNVNLLRKVDKVLNGEA